MGIKAIIWDLDGTLIHFNIDFMRARNNAIAILEKYGVSKNLLTHKVSILENVAESKKTLREKYDASRVKEILKEVDNAVIEVEYEAAIEASLIGGIDIVLKFAQENNIMQAIFTFNTSVNAKISLKKAGILAFFANTIPTS